MHNAVITNFPAIKSDTFSSGYFSVQKPQVRIKNSFVLSSENHRASLKTLFPHLVVTAPLKHA